MSLYLVLLIASITPPFLLSFDKKVAFYKQWIFLFPSILLVAALYILSDVWLTKHGVWGFNAPYHSSIVLGGLPLEEWLFFIAIPYASLFLHESLITYFPKIKLSKTTTNVISLTLILVFALLAIFHYDKTYTFYISIKMLLVLVIAFFDKGKSLQTFYITFLFILIPFLIVNGVLTGSFIEGEVVWYNNLENLGIRLFTIPIEDIAYAFSMLLYNLLLINWLRSKLSSPR